MCIGKKSLLMSLLCSDPATRLSIQTPLQLSAKTTHSQKKGIKPWLLFKQSFSFFSENSVSARKSWMVTGDRVADGISEGPLLTKEKVDMWQWRESCDVVPRRVAHRFRRSTPSEALATHPSCFDHRWPGGGRKLLKCKNTLCNAFTHSHLQTKADSARHKCCLVFCFHFLLYLVLVRPELERLHRGCASEIVTGLRLRR